MAHKHRHDQWWDRTAPQPDAEFDALHGGRELLPIEQAAYEAEGAERFARVHGHGRTFPEAANNWGPAPQPDQEPGDGQEGAT